MYRNLTALAVLLCAAPGRAADPAEVRAAIEQALPVLQNGARTFRERSEGRCIACHHQGPLQLAVALARERGFRVDEDLERAELDRIRGFYARRQELYRRALTDPAAARRADAFGNFAVHAGSTIWPIFISSASMFAGTCAVAVAAATTRPTTSKNVCLIFVLSPALKGPAYKPMWGDPFRVADAAALKGPLYVLTTTAR